MINRVSVIGVATALMLGCFLVSAGAQEAGDWYRIDDGVSQSHEEPHQQFSLQPFAERTAPSKAKEYTAPKTQESKKK